MTQSRRFEDIRITGVDKSRTYRPDKDKLLYDVYFELSAGPPASWGHIFAEERRFPRHSMWRRAWVEGHHIVVRCSLEEVKEYHLEDIKQDVENTNRKYRQHLADQAIAEERERERKEGEKRSFDDALNGLEFE